MSSLLAAYSSLSVISEPPAQCCSEAAAPAAVGGTLGKEAGNGRRATGRRADSMAAETSSSAEHRTLSERKARCGCRRACPGVNPWPHPSGPGASDLGAHLLAPQPLKLTEAQLGEASLPRPQGAESKPRGVAICFRLYSFM